LKKDPINGVATKVTKKPFQTFQHIGMKQIEPNPWTLIEEKYPVGTRVVGRVKTITDFGIFIGFEEGVDGLVHVSEMSWTKKVKHPSELFKKGQEVEAVVLNIDRKMSASPLALNNWPLTHGKMWHVGIEKERWSQGRLPM
jgi:ribosomal protein S1